MLNTSPMREEEMLRPSVLRKAEAGLRRQDTLLHASILDRKLVLLLHRRHLLWILCPRLIKVIGLFYRAVRRLLRLVALSIRLSWLLLSCWRRLVIGLLRPIVGRLLVL